MAGIYDKIAFALQVRRKDDKALRYYHRAHKAGCASPRFYASYTGLLLRMGHYQKAYDIITEGIREAVIKPKAKLLIKSLTSQYIISLWKLGRLSEAISEMEKVHAEMPTGNTYGTLGYLYIERGDKDGEYKQALEFNTEAIDYDDSDSVILDNMGQVLYRLGRLEDAKKYFIKALEEKPAQVDSLYYLARVCFDQGNRATAKELIKKAMDQYISNMATVTKDMVVGFSKKLEDA